MKNPVKRIALTAALVGGLLLPLGAAPANAYPSNCSFTRYNTFVYAKCGSGTGHYRVWAVCEDTVFWRSNTWIASWWQTPGSRWAAIATCPIGYTTWYGGIDAIN